jgi:hypothetical protein
MCSTLEVHYDPKNQNTPGFGLISRWYGKFVE